MEVVGYFFAVLVGITLGLIGSGGAILTVPILVYLFNINATLATTYSLFVVGVSSLVGSVKQYKQGNVHYKTLLVFGVPALITLLSIRKFVLPNIPKVIFQVNHFVLSKNVALMIAFAILMIAASVAMILPSNSKQKLTKISNIKLIVIGLLVGIVTGLLGAGGGFLIIPALVLLAQLDIKKAIGTSLFIIGINALLAFLSDIFNHVTIDFILLVRFSFFSIIGIFIGSYFSKKINGATLKPAFGWFILVMGLFIIINEVVINIFKM